MCLTVKVGCKIETTQNDIKVYKLVNKYVNYWRPIYRQESIDFEYGKLLTALDEELNLIEKLDSSFYNSIYVGFHSRVTKHHYVTNTICIIPKGSEICYGDDDDIVSTQLIVFKNRLQYLMYKLKRIL